MSASRCVRAGRAGVWVAVGLFWAIPTLCYGFAGGTGEPNDPYQIATAKDLLSIGSDPNLLSKHYLLVADIDLTANTSATAIIAPDTNGKAGFDGAAFTGTLNGRGHRISGLTIDPGKTGNDFLGLFGRIGNAGKVLHIGIETADVSGGRSAQNIGVLAGDNSGLIYQCYATGIISGSDWLDKVGGLTGSTDGVISQCYTMVDLSAGQFSNLAGFAGSNAGILTQCYAAGAVARGKFGSSAGFAGSNTGLVMDCYFLDSADGGGPDNGIGVALSDAQMKDASQLIGFDFSGASADGRLEAWVMPDQAYPVLAWQTDITGLVWVPEVRGMSLDEARTALAAAGLVVGKAARDFDSLVPVDKVVLITPAYPVAKGTTVGVLVSDGAYDWQQNAGKGTKEAPYQISSAGQLESMGQNSTLWSKQFVLTDVIDLTGRLYHDAVIAAYRGSTTFNGNLDGVGFEISGLTIVSPHDYVGLFGYLSGGSWQATGEVRNIVLTDAYVLARSATDTSSSGGAASLVGYNGGTVVDCSADGSVMGFRKVGGLVGRNSGAITRCMADTAVSGREYLGGLTGYVSSGSISLCYTTGNVIGTGNNLGGLVGYFNSYANTIGQCFAMGNISGVDYVGGLVGYFYSGTINECFAAGNATGNDNVGGLAGFIDAPVKKSFAMGAVSGRNRVGGLVGDSSDMLTQCYATGDISGNENVGGLTGYVEGYGSTVSECYAAGVVVGNKTVGGLVGYKYSSATVTNSFWNTATSGIAEGANGTALATADMQIAKTFTDVGWDFAQTWMICEGKDYPRFQWEAIECE